MRVTLKSLFVIALVDVFAFLQFVGPAQALVSTTGYVRVQNLASRNSMMVIQRPMALSSIGGAIAASGGAGSVGLRLVTSGLGWPALGVAAGMVLAQLVYDQTSVQAVRTAATPPGAISIPGSGVVPSSLNVCPGGGTTCITAGVYDQVITIPGCTQSPGVPGWQFYQATGTSPNTVCYYRHIVGNDSTKAVQAAGPPPTAQDIIDYLNGLPSNDPNSMESKTAPGGQNNPAVQTDNQTSQAVDPATAPTTVVPQAQVQPSDAVVNPNAAAPPGTQTTTPTTQTESSTGTTTTTTTTNPDGSVTTTKTETETETAAPTCTAGTHDERTFGTVLQEHLAVWQGSGLVSALNVLKTLTWPTTIPTYSLNSTLLGNFTLDFSQWGGMLLALRTIVIAMASFVAYRIVFVGSK
jgi:hypothetical protein